MIFYFTYILTSFSSQRFCIKTKIQQILLVIFSLKLKVCNRVKYKLFIHKSNILFNYKSRPTAKSNSGLKYFGQIKSIRINELISASVMLTLLNIFNTIGK